MSSFESETKSNRSKNNSTKKEGRKKFDMKKMAFYNPELISKRKVIINTSTSKEMYSFPTTKRFDPSIEDNSKFFYDIPSSLNKRSTSFGFGNKVEFKDRYQNPGPGTYDHLAINNKGRYMVSVLPNTQQNKFGNEVRFKTQTIGSDTPGPSTYYPEIMIKGDGIVYNSRYFSYKGKTMGQRLGKVAEKLITPGPGAYKYMNINKKGKYPSSLLSNSIQNKFGNEIRFKLFGKNENPGPSAYHPESMTKGNGIIYNSRYGTNLGKTIGIRLNELSKSETPGPGAYEFFSDFEGFHSYGKNNKKNKNGDQEDANDKENENENENEKDSGDGSNEGTNDDTGNSSANGNNLKEVFGKGVNDEISKVQIKKSKLK